MYVELGVKGRAGGVLDTVGGPTPVDEPGGLAETAMVGRMPVARHLLQAQPEVQIIAG